MYSGMFSYSNQPMTLPHEKCYDTRVSNLVRFELYKVVNIKCPSVTECVLYNYKLKLQRIDLCLSFSQTWTSGENQTEPNLVVIMSNSVYEKVN